jgi:hypothetical protein
MPGTTAGGTGGVSGTGGATGTGGTGISATAGSQGADPCPPMTCACDSQAAECQSVLENLCLGTSCPPSLDDAMLVANWPVDASTAPYPGRAEGTYNKCPDGHRTLGYTKDKISYWVEFEADGTLAAAVTMDEFASCPQFVCATDPNPPMNSACFACTMYADAPPARTLTPQLGQNNGPLPLCMIDTNGRWFMPYLDKTN